MKKIATIIFSMLLPLFSATGQNESIAITPYVSEELGLPQDIHDLLQNKLTGLITGSGFGSFSGDFILTPKISITDKGVTAGIPAKYTVSASTSFYIVAVKEKIIVCDIETNTAGIGGTENKALYEAVKSIRFNSPAMRAFMNGAREKINEYYEQRIPVLMAEAQMHAERKEYDEAVAVLLVVPESVDGYIPVLERINAYYRQQIDTEARKAIDRAKVLTVKGKTDEALDVLCEVDPFSTHYREAIRMVDAIAARKAEQMKEEQERIERMKDAEKAEEMRKNAAMHASSSAVRTDFSGSVLKTVAKELVLGLIMK